MIRLRRADGCVRRTPFAARAADAVDQWDLIEPAFAPFEECVEEDFGRFGGQIRLAFFAQVAISINKASGIGKQANPVALT
ncbi:MAG: hypothetical protein R2856_26815 [Caldilineaceae bacterium]